MKTVWTTEELAQLDADSVIMGLDGKAFTQDLFLQMLKEYDELANMIFPAVVIATGDEIREKIKYLDEALGF